MVRASRLFDELIVAVARNAGKNPMFNFDERVALVKESLKKQALGCPVRVIGFEGLLADLAIDMKASAIIRGLRAVSDFEYEFQMALINRKLAKKVETVFLMPSLSWVYLSSTMVKDLAVHNGNFKGLVPPPVIKAFAKNLKASRVKTRKTK